MTHVAGTPSVPGYDLDELLGTGSSGRVWRAHARATGASVAIKVLPAAGPAQRATAIAEAAVLAGLDHPHLVRLHELVPGDGWVALVLDLAAAGSLATLLAARGRLTSGEVVTALAPVAAALAGAHAAGVVHGDVSAANVLFTPIGFPLLADLGTARLLGEVPAGRCTPAYADPLVAAGDVPTAASDVFGLAAVAFHALTGRPVWEGDGADEVIAAAASGRVGDVAAALARAGAPEETAAVVATGLSADPARRPTAAEFALDLRCSTEPVAVELDAGRARREGVRPEPAFTHGLRLPLPELHRARHRRTATPGRRRRLRLVAVAGGVAACATAGTLLWWPAAAHDAPRAPVRAAASPPAARHGAALPAPEFAAVLDRLDARRSAAFAQRDVAALRDVYLPGPLLQADTALLLRLVPPGCGLAGVRNSYSGVRPVTRHAADVVVHAEVALRPSQLRCGGTVRASAPGSPPAALTLTLRRVAGGYRLAGIRPDPAPARTGRPRAAP